MWVTDVGDGKVYAYRMSDKTRDAFRDFDTLDDAGNRRPFGIWSNGTTMWVADDRADKIYAYAQWPRIEAFTSLHADNDVPDGIWSNGLTMWVTDVVETHTIFAYRMSDQSRDAGKDFILHADNAAPTGIWSNGRIMWVADAHDPVVYAYRMSDRTRVPGRDITAQAGSGFNRGIWSAGLTMWVVDSEDPVVYAYNILDGTRDPRKDFALYAGNSNPFGLWSDGTTMWVVDSGDDKAYAYEMLDGARNPLNDFELSARNTAGRGIWSDGYTVLVSDLSAAEIFAYQKPEYRALARPAAPTNLGASMVDGGVELSWAAPAGPAEGYEILRRRPNRGEKAFATLARDTGSATTTYTDTTATETGVRYTYRVKAIRNGVRSLWSNYATAISNYATAIRDPLRWSLPGDVLVSNLSQDSVPARITQQYAQQFTLGRSRPGLRPVGRHD